MKNILSLGTLLFFVGLVISLILFIWLDSSEAKQIIAKIMLSCAILFIMCIFFSSALFTKPGIKNQKPENNG
jgi:hypothetical protein